MKDIFAIRGLEWDGCILVRASTRKEAIDKYMKWVQVDDPISDEEELAEFRKLLRVIPRENLTDDIISLTF